MDDLKTVGDMLAYAEERLVAIEEDRLKRENDTLAANRAMEHRFVELVEGIFPQFKGLVHFKSWNKWGGSGNLLVTARVEVPNFAPIEVDFGVKIERDPEFVPESMVFTANYPADVRVMKCEVQFNDYADGPYEVVEVAVWRNFEEWDIYAALLMAQEIGDQRFEVEVECAKRNALHEVEKLNQERIREREFKKYDRYMEWFEARTTLSHGELEVMVQIGVVLSDIAKSLNYISENLP